VTPISVHGPFIPGPCSIRNPDSFDELSDHDRLIWLEDIAAADRLLGSAGIEAGVDVGAGPDVDVGVGVRVRVGVAVAVGDNAADVEVRVGVGVGVTVGPEVAVRVDVGESVGDPVGVAVDGTNVVAAAVFEYPESPAALYARTR
jgi:hypothetical protein